jgi:hypothetical protein
MVDGMMAFGKLENGLRILDFECCEDVVMKPFSGTFKVQTMRDGNIYLTEQPRRPRNKALFREDNSSLSLGQNGKYYFVFSLDEQRVGELPERLMSQAGLIARKMIRELVKRN